MGQYYEDNKNADDVDDALRERLEGGGEGWRDLISEIPAWNAIKSAPGGGWALTDYDAFFSRTINRAEPQAPSKADVDALGGNYDEWIKKANELKDAANSGTADDSYEVYLKELNRFVAELLGIPQDNYILPSGQVGRGKKRTTRQSIATIGAFQKGNYTAWHADLTIEDMQDVLLYLYEAKDNARKDQEQADTKLIEDLEKSVDESDDEFLTAALAYAKREAKGGQIEDDLTILLENLSDEDSRVRLYREAAQCVLRLNVGDYVRAHQITSANAATTPIAKLPRYHKSVYLSYGNGTTLINRLAHCEKSENFLEIKTHEISQLVPRIRLFKSYYEEGELKDEVEINFGNALLGPRSGVGIKSFDWKLNATNPATVRNDIEVTLVLFFESFNELLRPLNGVGTITGTPQQFRYEELLLRPPVEGTTTATPSEPPESSADCIQDNNTLYDPKFYEIKALVGWAPPPDLSGVSKDRRKKLLESIKAQKLPMFLTLIDHEFSFTQEGTFELSITYRARLEAIETDPRMDILTTADSKGEINKRLIKIQDLKKTCGSDTLVERQQGLIDDIDEGQRDILTESLIDDLQCSIYFTKLLRKDFFTALTFEADPSLQYRHGSITGLKVFEQDVIDSINTTQGNYRDEVKANLNQRFVVPEALETPAFGEEQQEPEKTELESGFISVRRESTNQPSPVNPETGASRPNWKPKRPNPPEEEILIPWFYFGDLANAVIKRCFDVNISTSFDSPGAISSVELENFIFLFSSFPIQEVGSNGTVSTIQANLADIPISLELFNQWYLENVINPNRRNYPVLEFLRDFISDAIIGTLNKDCYDSPAFRQLWFNAKSPVASDGSTPESRNTQRDDQGAFVSQYSYTDREKTRTPGDATLYEIPRLIMKTAAISLPSESHDGDPEAQTKNSLGGNPLEKTRTWSGAGYASAIINPDIKPAAELNLSRRGSSEQQTLKNSYHLNVFYLLNSDSYINFGPKGTNSDPDLPEDKRSDLDTREERDSKNGVYHLYLGADRGLVKSVNFTKVSAQYLREARIQQESLNPLAQLAATYNVNLKLIGNTIFWPGQYIFVNPIGFGNGLGHPWDRNGKDGFGSISNQLGLGGYHLITEVNNFIESGKFETEVKALFEFSGDGCPSLPGATPTSNCGNSRTATTSGTTTKDIAKPSTTAPNTTGEKPVSSDPASNASSYSGVSASGK